MTASRQKHLPLASKIIFALTALSAVLYLLFVWSADFADFFNRTVSPIGRFLLATLTAWIPFSLAEAMILMLLPLLIILVVIAYRCYCDSWRNTLVYIGILFSAVCTVFVLFVFNFAAGYYAPSLDKKLELDRTAVSAEELYDTASILRDEIAKLEEEILFLPTGDSSMLMSHTEMNEKLMDAYQKASRKYDFIDEFDSLVKPVMLSHPMSYTHITGVYTFFTGEANLNVNFPDYTLPFTAAHELAHQRGIAREDEANFVAFLVCMESDDPYIRYSAYLNIYEYVASALYSADSDAYFEIRKTLPDTVKAEQAAYSAFFDQYRDNIAADISQATNDAYLKGQGASAGTRSYNMVVDLAVAYYREK